MKRNLKAFSRLLGIALLVAFGIFSHVAVAEGFNPLLEKFAQERRARYRDMIPLAGVPEPVDKIRQVDMPASNPQRKISARLYVPRGTNDTERLPIVVFAHGGGYVSGDLDTHDAMLRAIANGTRSLVLSVDYRLAPEHPFPAGLEDIQASLQWVANHGDEIGANSSLIAISGDSAGGNLAAAATILSRDHGGPKIAAQWLMYATLSNRMDTESWARLSSDYFPKRDIMSRFIEAYLPSGMDRDGALVSPLYADLRGLPPALLQVGELDPLLDENFDYALALQKAGIEARAILYRGVEHGFIQYYQNPERNPHGEGFESLQAGIRFLREKFYPDK